MLKYSLILLLGLILTGCGRSEPPAPAAPPDAAPADPEADRPPDPEPAAPVEPETPEPPAVPEAEDTAAAPPPADPEQAARAALSHALILEQQGDFFGAFTALRDLSVAHPQLRTALELNDHMHRLRRHRENAPQVATALDRFETYTPRQLSIVQRQFMNIAETAGLLLRREVRESEDDARAGQALTLLLDTIPEAVPGSAAERVRHHPDSALRERCLALIEQHMASLDANALIALIEAAVEQTDRPDGAELRRLAAQAAARAPDAVIVELAGRIPLAETAPELAVGALQALAIVYHFGLGRADDVLARRIEPAGFSPDAVRAAAAHAAGHAEPAIAAAGHRAARLLIPVDSAALEADQAGRWTFATTRWPLLRSDIDAEPEDDSVSVSQAQMGNILDGSYSFAAWLKPSGLPTGEQPTPFSCVMRNQAWSMGLLLDTEGVVYYLHTSPGSETLTHCRSITPLPLNTWVHAVITRDLEAGRMVLYLDGEPVDATDFTPPAEPAPTEEDNTRPFRLLELPHEAEPDTTGTQFIGDADDLRLFNRALPADAIRDLYRLGRIW